MSNDLDKYIAGQRANDPEFAKAYDEERAYKVWELLDKQGWDIPRLLVLVVLEADRDLDELYPDL